MADQQTDAALAALVAAARRSDIGRRLQGDVETRLLQSIVDATVQLFDAEAASIALFEQDPDRLEFRVAAGEQGAGAVGLTVPPTQGIAGYVYSTGQALALSDVANDPRFNRDAAEQTGYVPRSIAAAPLLDEEGTVGVLQVLDKRGSPTFSLRDMELLAVFASQATVAIGAARVQRDTDRLLRSVLGQIGPDLDDEQVEALVGAATTDLDPDDEAPFWRLVEQVARLRGADRSRDGAAGRHPRCRGRARRQSQAPSSGAVTEELPAWSEPFVDPRRALRRRLRLRGITREWAWGGATGEGVRVGIIDSGIENDHPLLQGRVVENVTVEIGGEEPRVVPDEAGRHVRSRDRLRGDHRRTCAGGRARLDPRPRGRPARQGDGVCRRARVGDRAGAAGLQPEPVLEERVALSRSSMTSPTARTSAARPW